MRSLRACVVYSGENGWRCEHHRAAAPALSTERKTGCHKAGSHNKLCSSQTHRVLLNQSRFLKAGITDRPHQKHSSNQDFKHCKLPCQTLAFIPVITVVCQEQSVKTNFWRRSGSLSCLHSVSYQRTKILSFKPDHNSQIFIQMFIKY